MKKRFADFITLQRGFDLPKTEMEEGPFPVVGSTSIIGFHNQYKVEPPGVIMGRSGSLGTIQYISQPYWPHNTSLWVKDFKNNDPRFVYYCLQGFDFARFNAGSGVPTLNRNHLDSLEVEVPEFSVQQRIASILSAYDDLIENNARRIAILEVMARRIYEEWFVHFRFPGHQKVKLVDSKIGLIPKGWEISKLSALVKTQYGYTESATEKQVGPKFLRGMDINKTSYIKWEEVPYCPIPEDDYTKFRLELGDILVIRMADPGKVGIVEKDVKAVFASYLIRLRITSRKLSPYYLFYFLLSDAYQSYVAGASTGTTRKSASAGVIVDLNIVVPSNQIRLDFENNISSIRLMINNLLEKNANLRTTRDLLLPKLISGEIDVSHFPAP